MNNNNNLSIAYLELQNKIALSIFRPFSVAISVIWLWYAIIIDHNLHPEITHLFRYRMGFLIINILLFLLSFSDYLKKYVLSLLKTTYFMLLISTAIISGSLFNDPNYLGGYQIVVIVSLFIPISVLTMIIYFIISFIVFIGCALMFNNSLIGVTSYYVFHNLFIGYVVGLIGVYTLNRYRFNLLLDRLKLEEMATTDSLTQVYNRGYFLKCMDLELQKSVRHNQQISLMVMDLDYFKKINDSYGHPAGDYVLKKFASICKQQIREIDIIGRLGGEEFMILLPHTTIEDAIMVAERIRTSVSKNHYTPHQSITINVTVSIGLVSYPHIDVKNSNDFLVKADECLYLAKNNGRNQVYSILNQEN